MLPLLFQDAFGWTPIEAGATVLFLFIGNLAIKPATTWMLRRFGFRLVLVTANVAGIVAMAGMALFTEATPIVAIMVVLVLSGVARSIGFTAYNTIAFADLEPKQLTGANVLNSTVQQAAAGIGIAVAGVALTTGYALIGAAPAVSGGASSPVFPYQLAFLVLGAITLVPTVEAWLLSRTAGSSVITR